MSPKRPAVKEIPLEPAQPTRGATFWRTQGVALALVIPTLAAWTNWGINWSSYRPPGFVASLILITVAALLVRVPAMLVNRRLWGSSWYRRMGFWPRALGYIGVDLVGCVLGGLILFPVALGMLFFYVMVPMSIAVFPYGLAVGAWLAWRG